MVAAAFMVMDKVLRAVLVEEVKDIFWEEGVDMPGVGSEVVVVFVQATVELEEVEVTLGEMVQLMNSSPVEEEVDLLTMEQISKMNVVSIAINMAEWSSRFFSEMDIAALSLTCSGHYCGWAPF